MAKLYFYYSAMNAGKSTVLLQSAHNYHERGMQTLLFTSKMDHRYGTGKISSRIGLASDALMFDEETNLFTIVKTTQQQQNKLACILVDEAQFLTQQQVLQLTDVVDDLNIPVLAYGLRSDYRGQAFAGSLALLTLADNLCEIKTICHCGRKAIMNRRIDEKGNVIRSGDQVHIGGNESYIAVCRKHYKAD